MIRDWRFLKHYMDRDYGINNGIWNVYPRRDDVIDTLNKYKISLVDDNGQCRMVSSVLGELSHWLMRCWKPSDGRKISDTMDALVHGFATIEELTSNTSDELDSFLDSFKITDKEVHCHG